MRIADILKEVGTEYQNATSKFAPFNSPHEGKAIIQEELDELWDQIKIIKNPRGNPAMKKEAIQIAAMAVRFIIDLC